jgi:hypothetical protein
VLLKVQRLHLCLNGANRKTAKQNTHTTPMNKKTKCTFKGEYNAKVGVCFMEKDQHNRVLSCMSAQGFCLLVAVIKGQNSEVTLQNHALFEFNPMYHRVRTKPPALRNFARDSLRRVGCAANTR